MKAALVLVLELLLLAISPAWALSLFGAKLLRVVPEKHDQLLHLRKMLVESPYDFWREPRKIGLPVDIMVTISQLPKIIYDLTSQGLMAEEMIKDVGQMIVERVSIYSRGPRAMDWEDFHDYTTIIQWLNSLVKDYPDLCTLEDVGKSYEDRAIKLLKVGKGGADKPVVFVESGMHAREWIAPATVTYMINKLVTNSTEYENLLSQVNFYFMPVTNPDGYDFTFMRSISQNQDRLWRKTRSDYRPKESEDLDDSRCIGVDLNRNWDYHWMEVGSCNNSCRQVYAGPEPFSEVENRVVRDLVMGLRSKIKMYLSFHSYGQQFLYPWAYTSVYPDDWKMLDRLARKAVSALTSVYGTGFEVGTACEILDGAKSGGSIDWVKGVAGVKLAYAVELGECMIPIASDIILTGEETFQAFLVLANHIKETYSH
ncbi:LOW QUALITY PROTEIN: carboxypeptidase B-like [Portunus trituberculatus]|uniref:LOW QUALITY PROTEIN: carboxypeptidase B-like n=1 Tax=Portunus trituberculatus TaxID=210409 RepID=UPI001E1CC898|nr:LOW QUALITY PROTEIN: carboxypeptidase B-like [Portunus trituberculatus]